MAEKAKDWGAVLPTHPEHMFHHPTKRDTDKPTTLL